MKPFVHTILQYLIPIVNSHGLNTSLLENTAITLGRLAKGCPDMVAPLLDKFFDRWCLILCGIREASEKKQAFESLCIVIVVNPQAVLPKFHILLQCIAHESYPKQGVAPLSEALKTMFHELLHKFKNLLGAQWQQASANCPREVMAFLEQVYQV